MLTLSVGSASCSEDEPIQGTGQQVTPGNGSGFGDNGSNNNGNNPDDNNIFHYHAVRTYPLS